MRTNRAVGRFEHEVLPDDIRSRCAGVSNALLALDPDVVLERVGAVTGDDLAEIQAAEAVVEQAGAQEHSLVGGDVDVAARPDIERLDLTDLDVRDGRRLAAADLDRLADV